MVLHCNYLPIPSSIDCPLSLNNKQWQQSTNHWVVRHSPASLFCSVRSAWAASPWGRPGCWSHSAGAPHQLSGSSPTVTMSEHDSTQYPGQTVTSFANLLSLLSARNSSTSPAFSFSSSLSDSNWRPQGRDFLIFTNFEFFPTYIFAIFLCKNNNRNYTSQRMWSLSSLDL